MAGAVTPDGDEEAGVADAWAFAAQALACVGERDAALELIQRAEPTDRGERMAWRPAARQARIAVAVEAAAYDPAWAAALMDGECERLLASRNRPRGMALLLPSLVELLPAAWESCRERLEDAIEIALEYTGEGREAWRPETVLVHALLRIRDGDDAGCQLDWLTGELRSCDPERFPTGGLAVAHAVLGDIESARQVAERLRSPESRAAAFAAVAGQLARVPVRPSPTNDAAAAGPFTRTVRPLALAASADAPADLQAATGFVRDALAGAGWHHALPLLSELAPEAVTQVRDIAAVHLGFGAGD
ncbi:hypothetical protein [Streptomyces sp. NPDC089799]|uniref:hypothetical protein n=1 Tax=Streptomyces sp. NPDC089799 TaxID=3155066 RepID=UPI00342646C0